MRRSTAANARRTTRSGLPRGAGGVQADRRGLALQRQGGSRLEALPVRTEGAQRGLGDEDLVAGAPRGGLDAGGGVDRVPDHREVAPAAAADRADHDTAGVHAHSDPQRAAVAPAYEGGDL